MKLDNIEIKQQEQVRIEKQAQQNKELKRLGSVRRIKGLNLYKWNIKTGEIKQINIKKDMVIDFADKKPKSVAKCTFEEYCLYCQALNLENAKKKFLKMINSYGNKKY